MRGNLVKDWNGRGPHKVYVGEEGEFGNTDVTIPDETSLGDILRNMPHLWAYHSTEAPGWVILTDPEDSDPAYAERIRQGIADHFRITEPSPETITDLITTAGLDFAAAQLSGAASATAIAKWVAVTANATAPAIGDTTLTAEIVTAGGGLLRAPGTYAHTGGTSTYTVTITLTINGSDAIPITLAKAGIFTAITVGTLVYEDAISPTVTLSSVGDAITLTDTVTV